jgi:hypothetical protein
MSREPGLALATPSEIKGKTMANQSLRMSLAVLAVVAFGGWANAQVGDFKPISKPGGYAQQELHEIYRQSIGTGYSGASLNAITMHSARANTPYVRSPATVSGGPRIGLGVGASTTNKPFNSYSPAPTVSPYLNLFREDLAGNDDLNYNTLVRPMLQQQQFNQQVQRQSLELERRLQSFAAQSDFNPQGSEQQLPTGHQTVFRYYGRYYPAMNRVRR